MQCVQKFLFQELIRVVETLKNSRMRHVFVLAVTCDRPWRRQKTGVESRRSPMASDAKGAYSAPSGACEEEPYVSKVMVLVPGYCRRCDGCGSCCLSIVRGCFGCDDYDYGDE